MGQGVSSFVGLWVKAQWASGVDSGLVCPFHLLVGWTMVRWLSGLFVGWFGG